MKDNRPKNLDLTTIKQPLPAIVSILHRISGFVVFLAIPVLLWLVQLSLASEASFEQARAVLGQPLLQLVLWGILIALFFHFVAGIRHLLMDMGFAEGLQAGRRSAQTVLGVAIVLALLAGVWVW